MLLQRLPILIALLIAAALAGSLYWQLAPLFINADKAPLETATTIKPAINNTPKQITRNIAAFNLFGDTAKVVKKPAPVTKNLPKTTLRLTLTGVMSSGTESAASALIQGPDRDTLNYRVNDELPGGAVLKQVFSDRVVIERSGRLENLAFVETKQIGIQNYTHPDDEPLAAEPPQTPASLPARAAPQANPGRTQGIKDRLNKLRKRMLKNRTQQ